jgi:hypothetical protein
MLRPPDPTPLPSRSYGQPGPKPAGAYSSNRRQRTWYTDVKPFWNPLRAARK